MWTPHWRFRIWSRASTAFGYVRVISFLHPTSPVHGLMMVMNVMVGFFFLVAGLDKGYMLVLGLVYAINYAMWLIPSCLYGVRPTNKAFSDITCVSFMLFFIFCQFLFSCVMALGIPGSGGAGIMVVGSLVLYWPHDIFFSS